MASLAAFSFRRAAAAGAVVALAGCAVAPPSGPQVVAMPGTGKTYEQFTNDDATCRQAAAYQAGPPPGAEQTNNAVVGSSLLGAGLGAAAGAAIGSASGAVGGGAAIGGALGLLAGSAIGASNAQAGAGNLQQRYDITYSQCMAANGNQIQQPPPPPPVIYSGFAPPYGYVPYPYYYRPYPYYRGPWHHYRY